MIEGDLPELLRARQDHEKRLRNLEAFRERHEGATEVKEKSMSDALRKIDEHLALQDDKIDKLTRVTTRWGGGLAVVLGSAGIIVAVIEVVKSLGTH